MFAFLAIVRIRDHKPLLLFLRKRNYRNALAVGIGRVSGFSRLVGLG